MTKEITVVYQDCFLCGERGRWKIEELAEKGISLRKVGFATEEGRELCHQAVMVHGIGSMPFFTDGKIFAATLKPFYEDEPRGEETGIPAAEGDKVDGSTPEEDEKARKTATKQIKRAGSKGEKNGAISKA